MKNQDAMGSIARLLKLAAEVGWSRNELLARVRKWLHANRKAHFVIERHNSKRLDEIFASLAVRPGAATALLDHMLRRAPFRVQLDHADDGVGTVLIHAESSVLAQLDFEEVGEIGWSFGNEVGGAVAKVANCAGLLGMLNNRMWIVDDSLYREPSSEKPVEIVCPCGNKDVTRFTFIERCDYDRDIEMYNHLTGMLHINGMGELSDEGDKPRWRCRECGEVQDIKDEKIFERVEWV